MMPRQNSAKPTASAAAAASSVMTAAAASPASAMRAIPSAPIARTSPFGIRRCLMSPNAAAAKTATARPATIACICRSTLTLKHGPLCAAPDARCRLGRQAGEARADRAEQVVDVVAEQCRAAGNRQRDKDDQHRVFGRGRAAIVTAKAFEQSEHVHTPEIEPVTDPFAPRWNRRGRPAPAKAAYFCGPVRFGATYGHVCIKFCLVCNGKLALTNKK